MGSDWLGSNHVFALEPVILWKRRVLLAGFGSPDCFWSQRDGGVTSTKLHGPKKGVYRPISKKVGVGMLSTEADIFWRGKTIGAHDIGLGGI